jgi:hypothetical protein
VHRAVRVLLGAQRAARYPLAHDLFADTKGLGGRRHRHARVPPGVLDVVPPTSRALSGEGILEDTLRPGAKGLRSHPRGSEGHCHDSFAGGPGEAIMLPLRHGTRATRLSGGFAGVVALFFLVVGLNFLAVMLNW